MAGSTDRALALALLNGGRDCMSADEIREAARILGCTTRSVYRYLDRISRARFFCKDVEFGVK